MYRRPVSEDTFHKVIDECKVRWRQRLDPADKGPGVFASNHEALGVVAEEYAELLTAIQSNDAGRVYGELLDIAVACLHGMATILAKIASAPDPPCDEETTEKVRLKLAALCSLAHDGCRDEAWGIEREIRRLVGVEATKGEGK